MHNLPCLQPALAIALHNWSPHPLRAQPRAKVTLLSPRLCATWGPKFLTCCDAAQCLQLSFQRLRDCCCALLLLAELRTVSSLRPIARPLLGTGAAAIGSCWSLHRTTGCSTSTGCNKQRAGTGRSVSTAKTAPTATRNKEPWRKLLSSRSSNHSHCT